MDAQISMLEAQELNVPKQGILLDTQEERATEEVLTQTEQTKMVAQQILQSEAQQLGIEANTLQTKEQTDILQKQKGFGTMR